MLRTRQRNIESQPQSLYNSKKGTQYFCCSMARSGRGNSLAPSTRGIQFNHR
uniref:Uncharacterized protein n=1 Tax=Arundo donax TaxID=35708 RepID=A0A0A8YJN9_ARUDO